MCVVCVHHVLAWCPQKPGRASDPLELDLRVVVRYSGNQTQSSVRTPSTPRLWAISLVLLKKKINKGLRTILFELKTETQGRKGGNLNRCAEDNWLKGKEKAVPGSEGGTEAKPMAREALWRQRSPAAGKACSGRESLRACGSFLGRKGTSPPWRYNYSSYLFSWI